MAIVETKLAPIPTFTSWENIDRIFEQAFAPRLVTSPLPSFAEFDPPKRPSNPTPSAQQQQQPFISRNPYAVFRPTETSPARYESTSDDSPLFSSPEPSKMASVQQTKTESSSSASKALVKRDQPPKPKKRRSRLNFRDSSDGTTVTATFDLPGIHKSDVHVSFQPTQLIVTWEYTRTTETYEGDKIVRERKEKKYIRTVQLPEGIKFEDVKATMEGCRLTITFPKNGSAKAVPIQ